MTVRRETFELLDGLRGLAAIAVVALHVGDAYGLPYGISHGYLAVPFFFTLSGIVIAHAYENGVMRTVPPLAFLAIRIERLYPLLVMGLILSVTLSVARAVLKGGDTSILETGALLLAAVLGAGCRQHGIPVASATMVPCNRNLGQCCAPAARCAADGPCACRDHFGRRCRDGDRRSRIRWAEHRLVAR